MTEDERNLLFVVAAIVLVTHTGSGPDAMEQRAALNQALAPFKDQLQDLIRKRGA